MSSGKSDNCVRRIRVLHVVVSLDAGGMERVLSRVASDLAHRGFDFCVCGLERRGLLADLFYAPEQVVSLGKPDGRSMRSIWRLHRLVRKMKPDVIHTHNLGPLIYAAAASGFGVISPILHGEHCQLQCQELGSPRLPLRRVLYRACRRIHTVSDESRRELVGFGFSPARVVSVVNGVDSSVYVPGFSAEARRQLGLPAEGRVVAVVARFEQRKRHQLMIEAVASLLAQGLDVHLLLAGDGELRPQLEELAQASGAGARVRFLGFRNDVETVYRASDLVVLPSTGEGLSNSILEAMACGTPVLCHDACGCAEVITHGTDGWVMAMRSAGELSERLGVLLADTAALRAAGLAARRKVIERFDFRQTVDAYERLYRQVAGSR